MMRKFRPRDLERMLRSMGVKVQSLDAIEVLIRLRGGTSLKISDPQVSVTKVGGEEVYQIMGRAEEIVKDEETQAYEPSEDDIALVSSQASVSYEDARKALIKAQGDLAEAILKLKGEAS